MTPDPTDRTVTRGDIEAKLAEIRQVTERTKEAAAPTGRGPALAGVGVIVLLAYLFGRRRGRRRSTIVEVRRV